MYTPCIAPSTPSFTSTHPGSQLAPIPAPSPDRANLRQAALQHHHTALLHARLEDDAAPAVEPPEGGHQRLPRISGLGKAGLLCAFAIFMRKNPSGRFSSYFKKKKWKSNTHRDGTQQRRVPSTGD